MRKAPGPVDSDGVASRAVVVFYTDAPDGALGRRFVMRERRWPRALLRSGPSRRPARPVLSKYAEQLRNNPRPVTTALTPSWPAPGVCRCQGCARGRADLSKDAHTKTRAPANRLYIGLTPVNFSIASRLGTLWPTAVFNVTPPTGKFSFRRRKTRNASSLYNQPFWMKYAQTLP
jgi:hypothetical protein